MTRMLRPCDIYVTNPTLNKARAGHAPAGPGSGEALSRSKKPIAFRSNGFLADPRS